MKPALLLVDLQNDYLRAAALEPAAEILVERAVRVLESARQHSLPIIHIWTTVNAPGQYPDNRMPHWKNASKWSCVAGSEGHQTPELLRPRDDEFVIHKQFFSGFQDEALEQILKARCVDTVLLAGVHLHACVRSTALDAYARGFRVLVAEDAVASGDALHAAITRRYLQQRAISFVSARSFLASLDEKTPAQSAAPRLCAAIIADEEIDEPALRDWLHVSPRDGSSLWRVPVCEAAQITSAATSSKIAERTWRDSSTTERVELLKRFSLLLHDQSEKLARQMAIEIGKPIAQGRAEIARSVELLQTIASYADEPLEKRCAPDCVARFRPLGTIAVITPWNNPIAIPIGKIAPAIFYGNAVMWKPAPVASAISMEIMALWQRAACPSGLIHLVCGDHSTSALLMNCNDVDAVTFTGSVASGYAPQEICARRHVPLQAELGGNNAAIVWRDCDLPNAARQIAEAAFGFAGQRCTANRRVIVENSVYDQFLSYLESATRDLSWGDPLNEETQIGPLISQDARAQSSTRIEIAQQKAMRVLRPHENDLAEPMKNGAYFPPTIVCCDDATSEIVQEESFAPILVVQRAAHWDEAMSLCNGVRQGLAAALFSDSPELQKRFLDEARCGILKINGATANANARAPFGGWKASGLGPPEHGDSNREFYTRAQAVYGA